MLPITPKGLFNIIISFYAKCHISFNAFMIGIINHATKNTKDNASNVAFFNFGFPLYNNFFEIVTFINYL